ncbi:MAG: hypothetical protein ACKV19_11670, partial [Verrucomicrobiales bacterium]
ENAKRVQANLICIAENLLLLLSHQLELEEGVRNEAEIKRRADRLDKAMLKVREAGAHLPLPVRKVQRLTQNSVKFIRWVATLLFLHVPWKHAVNQLRASYATL